VNTSPVTSIKADTLDTWNTCPQCNLSWKEDIKIPGIIHRTTLCNSCAFNLKIELAVRRIMEIDGFTGMRQSELSWLIQASVNKKCIVELGSCYGHSTIALAQSGAKVIAVDDFYGPRDVGMGENERAEIYSKFLKNTKNYSNITSVVMDHKDYFPPPDCDMVFIDGEHSYEAVTRDVKKYLNHKPILICGHDYEWWLEVKRAVDDLFPNIQVWDNNLWHIDL
jgi:GMP synthase-like glutamine amidotransferase